MHSANNRYMYAYGCVFDLNDCLMLFQKSEYAIAFDHLNE